MKRLFTYVLAVVALIFLLVIMPGYRLTSESAATAHSFLPETAHLAKEYRTSLGNVFIYGVENYYLTIVPKKVGPLWIANASASSESINDKGDKVRTIGLYSSGRNGSVGTIMVIDVQDDGVKYIEAGEEKQRIRKSVVPGEYVEFEWDKPFFPQDINAVALSEDGKELYRYNYGNIANYTDTSELRWHEVETDNAKAKLEIFLVKNLTTDEALKIRLEDLPLESAPIITDKEIKQYDWQTHTFIVKDDFNFEEALNGKVPMDGRPFVLIADGVRIYAGSFWSVISSQFNPNIPTITSVWHAGMVNHSYSIHYNINKDDPRGDMRIYEALKTLEKVE